MQRWVPQRKLWRETPMCFATNFFVARRAWFASDNPNPNPGPSPSPSPSPTLTPASTLALTLSRRGP